MKSIKKICLLISLITFVLTLTSCSNILYCPKCGKPKFVPLEI